MSDSSPPPPRLPGKNLSGKQRRFLRSEAHHLDSLIQVGKEGLSDSVVAAIAQALNDHELVKLRVLENAPLDRRQLADELPGRVGAHCVGQIGHVVTLYRRHPTRPQVALPQAG